MDIEGPHKPIESLKDFLLHLLTITIGILIALGLEGVVHSHHDKAIVREAITSLDAEIDRNQARVLKHREELTKFVDEMNQLQAQIRARRGGAKFSDTDLDIHPPVTLLLGTAWEAASATEAVILMVFQQAQRYASLYALQRTFLTYQDRSLDLWLDAISTAEDERFTSSSELAESDHKVSSALLRAKAFAGLDDALIALLRSRSVQASR